jgi:non-reducing end alpha-L-arabinofuranosidase
MMSRGMGLISLLLGLTVALAACNGDSPGSQASGVANASTSPTSSPATNSAAQANADATTDAASKTPLPCDAASAAGTPCSAAHSVVRLLTKNYAGPLFQVQRASDGTTQNIFPYTSSTAPHGDGNSLVGSANLKSLTSFCNNTTCSITYLYDQIDQVAALKGGTYGNVTGTLSLTASGGQQLTIPSSSTSAAMTVPVINGFATITLPGTGTLTVQLSQPPTALTTSAPSQQVSIGNDLPALPGTPAKLTYMNFQGTQIPALATLAGQAYRNRFGTVNQSIGDTEISEYMVAGAHYDQSSTCCGTYGNMENSANPGTYKDGEVEGMMFALAYSNGAAAVFGYCDGDGPQSPTTKDPVCNGLDINWPGVDAEAGVYLYGPQQPKGEKFMTVLAKYSPVTASNIFAVKGGASSQTTLTTDFEQAPPEAYIFSNPAGHAFNGQWEGGLSLGEGGDGSAAPIEFFEGAVLTKMSSDATDNQIQASIANYYGPPSDPVKAACYANNLVNSPLSLAIPDAWTQSNGGTALPATGISGNAQDAASVTATNGSSVANIHDVIRVQGGQTYTFTDYVAATSNATVFPGGSVQTDDPSGTEFGWVVNTNTGAAVRGTWGGGQATSISAVKVGAWWKVSMTFTAPAGSNNATVYIDPPTSSAAGVRSQQTPYLTATHYCPALAIVPPAAGSAS